MLTKLQRTILMMLAVLSTTQHEVHKGCPISVSKRGLTRTINFLMRSHLLTKKGDIYSISKKGLILLKKQAV